ncbi:MAG: cytochrome C [Piscirickettsiaceae bacterium]|nr:MAG: cytochrome C [Piscirickettsiaceae bacterium]
MYRQFFVLFLLIIFSFSAFAAMPVQKLLQLIDYVGVDYREAIKDGQVINPEEYGEMQDFALAIQENIHQLSPIKQNLIEQASTLGRLVNSKASPDHVAELTTTMHRQIIADYDIQVVPNKVPDFNIAKQLYAQNCIACHGAKGAGDGSLSKTLEPLPTNFLNRERFRERTLYGLFSTVTQGVSGTSMPAFNQLTEHERWSLAFYVGQLAVQEKEATAGATLWESKDSHLLSSVEQLTTSSPAQLETSSGQDAVSTLAYLRRHPEALMNNKQSPLDFSIQELDASRQAYRAGDVDKAYDLAINAYLEGFELIENSLDAIDSELRREIEGEMTGYRNLIRKQKGEQAVNAAFSKIKVLLETARSLLNETSLSGKTAFISAMVIILREGLEALLVVAALAAFLVKTGKREGLAYLYSGVVVALLMGGLTWVVSTTLIEIGGASRELTEGIAAITAAFVLFYVGFWMHNKTSAAQWKHFIESSIKKALNKETLWGIAALSFIAVYREVFESVLFYQALWVQTNEGGQNMIVYGLATATAILSLVAWLIMKYSTRLPLRQFFAVSGGFMFILAVVFAGKGISALQEAGKIPLDPVALPSIDLLGIYPNYQGLAVQGLMIILATVMIIRDNRKQRNLNA